MDFSTGEREYTGFMEFIKKLPEPTKNELKDFIYPMFVYIYLELIRERKPLDAQKFHALHCEFFLKANGYTDVIKKLVQLKTVAEVYTEEYFQQFWLARYFVQVSDEYVDHFKSYLKETNSIFMLRFLEKDIDIKARDIEPEHPDVSSTIKYDGPPEITNENVYEKSGDIERIEYEEPPDITSNMYMIAQEGPNEIISTAHKNVNELEDEKTSYLLKLLERATSLPPSNRSNRVTRSGRKVKRPRRFDC